MALLLSAFGGSDDAAPGLPAAIPAPPPRAPTPAPPPAPSPPPGGLSCGATAISANHGHTLAVPEADLDSLTSKTYSIRGSGDHDHAVVLAPAQLQLIKAKTAVLVNSSIEMAHFHEVTVNCA